MLSRLILIFFGFTLCIVAVQWDEDEVLLASIPDNWPDPVYDFQSHPISKKGFELGRKLFHDPGLSLDSTISCASCHSQFNAFTHVDHPVSHGIQDRIGKRNSPVLINLAWSRNFHWDGGVVNLQMQPLNPIMNPVEMDNTIENVLAYLNAHPEYPSLFYQIYGDSTITTKSFLSALEQFTVSLISSNSKYDQFIKGDVKFTKQEKNGLKLFRKHCSTCHPEPLFTTNSFANNGIPKDTSDLGRYGITMQIEDSYLFKIPTLRNIAYSFPYMHNGSFKRLQDVIEHYNSGIDRGDERLSPVLRNEMNLSDMEKKDLLAFLNTLTDKSFMFNRSFME